jgi:hypothetical protein
LSLLIFRPYNFASFDPVLSKLLQWFRKGFFIKKPHFLQKSLPKKSFGLKATKFTSIISSADLIHNKNLRVLPKRIDKWQASFYFIAKKNLPKQSLYLRSLQIRELKQKGKPHTK